MARVYTDAEVAAIGAQPATDAPPIPEPVRPVTRPEVAQQISGALATPFEGMTLGHGGEISGGLGAIGEVLMRGGDVREAYGRHREAFDRPRTAFETRHPSLSLGLEVAGGASTLGPVAASAALSSYARAHPLLTSALLGTAGAAATGAGKAPTLAQAPEEAAAAAPYGTAGGVLGPMFASGIARTGAMAGRGLTRLGQAGAGRGAQRAGELVELDEMRPSEIVARMRRRGPESRMGDFGVSGPNVREQAEVLAVTPGRTAAVAHDFLRSRQAQSIPRIYQAMRRYTGQSGRYLEPYRDILRRRAEQASPLYEAAKDDVVSVEQLSPLLMHLDERITDLAGTPLGNQLGRIKRMLYTTEEGVRTIKTNVGRQLHAVKLEIDRAVGRSLRQEGGGPLYRELKDAQRELLEVMDNSDNYRRARAAFAEESAIKDAAELGRGIFRGDIENLADDVARMGDSEREAFLMGAARSIVGKVGGEGAESGAANRLMRNVEVRERLRAAFPDEGAYQDFMRVVETEQDYARIFNRIMNQSATAQRLAAGDLPTSRWQALDRIAKWATRNIGTDPQIVIDELGKVLWEFGPDQVERALRENRLSARAVQGLMERIRGGTALAGGHAGALMSLEE